MAAGFADVFSALKPILASHAKALVVKTDTATEYLLVTKSRSPFPQHKGNPMQVAWLQVGKAYVSFHLMTLYMSPALSGSISPALKKRMQGKTCFNFKDIPPPELIAELKLLTDTGVRQWADRKWL